MRNRRIFAIFAVLALLCALNIPVFAAEEPDMERECSVTIQMQDNGTPVPGGTLTIFRVGEIVMDDEGYFYVLTDAFAPSGLSLEDFSSSTLAQALADYALNTDGLQSLTVELSQKGEVTVSSMPVGLYLFVQEQAAEGYKAVTPFLVTLPMFDGEQYQYDVDASPKISLEQAPPEETTPTEPTPTVPDDPKLPQTGQLNWPVPILVIAGLALIIFGWWLRLSRRDRDYED